MNDPLARKGLEAELIAMLPAKAIKGMTIDQAKRATPSSCSAMTTEQRKQIPAENFGHFPINVVKSWGEEEAQIFSSDQLSNLDSDQIKGLDKDFLNNLSPAQSASLLG